MQFTVAKLSFKLLFLLIYYSGLKNSAALKTAEKLYYIALWDIAGMYFTAEKSIVINVYPASHY